MFCGLFVVHLCCRLMRHRCDMSTYDEICRHSLSGCQWGRLEWVCHDSPNRNDERRPMSLSVVWLPHRSQRCGTWILHGPFHPLVVVWVRGQSFGFMGGHWHSWAVRFIVPHSGCWALCGGCRWRHHCLVVVVVDGRKEGCHTLWP